MLTLTYKHKVFLAVHPIDFRKRLDGTLSICRNQLQFDPRSGHVFVFRNKKTTTVRCIIYDGDGFWLSEKRLSQGVFKLWPKTSFECCELTPTQLQVLLGNQPSPI